MRRPPKTLDEFLSGGLEASTAKPETTERETAESAPVTTPVTTPVAAPAAAPAAETGTRTGVGRNPGPAPKKAKGARTGTRAGTSQASNSQASNSQAGKNRADAPATLDADASTARRAQPNAQTADRARRRPVAKKVRSASQSERETPPPGRSSSATVTEDERRARTVPGEAARTVTMSVRVPVELRERLEDIVAAYAGVTFSDLVIRGLEEMVERAEERYRDAMGEAIPKRGQRPELRL